MSNKEKKDVHVNKSINTKNKNNHHFTIHEDNDMNYRCNNKIRTSHSSSNISKNKHLNSIKLEIHKQPDNDGIDLISNNTNIIGDLVEKSVNLLHTGNIYKIKKSLNHEELNANNDEIYHKKSKFYNQNQNYNNSNSNLQFSNSYSNIKNPNNGHVHFNFNDCLSNNTNPNINTNSPSYDHNYIYNDNYYNNNDNSNINSQNANNLENINYRKNHSNFDYINYPCKLLTPISSKSKKIICVNDSNKDTFLDHDSSRYVLDKYFNSNSTNNKGGIVDLNIYYSKTNLRSDITTENKDVNNLHYYSNDVFTLEDKNDVNTDKLLQKDKNDNPNQNQYELKKEIDNSEVLTNNYRINGNKDFDQNFNKINHDEEDFVCNYKIEDINSKNLCISATLDKYILFNNSLMNSNATTKLAKFSHNFIEVNHEIKFVEGDVTLILRSLPKTDTSSKILNICNNLESLDDIINNNKINNSTELNVLDEYNKGNNSDRIIKINNESVNLNRLGENTDEEDNQNKNQIDHSNNKKTCDDIIINRNTNIENSSSKMNDPYKNDYDYENVFNLKRFNEFNYFPNSKMQRVNDNFSKKRSRSNDTSKKNKLSIEKNDFIDGNNNFYLNKENFIKDKDDDYKYNPFNIFKNKSDLNLNDSKLNLDLKSNFNLGKYKEKHTNYHNYNYLINDLKGSFISPNFSKNNNENKNSHNKFLKFDDIIHKNNMEEKSKFSNINIFDKFLPNSNSKSDLKIKNSLEEFKYNNSKEVLKTIKVKTMNELNCSNSKFSGLNSIINRKGESKSKIHLTNQITNDKFNETNSNNDLNFNVDIYIKKSLESNITPTQNSFLGMDTSNRKIYSFYNSNTKNYFEENLNIDRVKINFNEILNKLNKNLNSENENETEKARIIMNDYFKNNNKLLYYTNHEVEFSESDLFKNIKSIHSKHLNIKSERSKIVSKMENIIKKKNQENDVLDLLDDFGLKRNKNKEEKLNKGKINNKFESKLNKYTSNINDANIINNENLDFNKILTLSSYNSKSIKYDSFKQNKEDEMVKLLNLINKEKQKKCNFSK